MTLDKIVRIFYVIFVTLYFFLNAFIHWVGPEGPTGSWSSGVVNSVPFVVLLLLGLSQLKSSQRVGSQSASRIEP